MNQGVVLSLGLVTGTTVTILWSRLPMPIPLCMTTFVVPNVIIIIGLILVTASNAVL